MSGATGMPAGRSLCNDSHLQEQDGQCVVVGDPTEGALIVAARKAGLTQQALEQEMPRLDTIPFESTFSTWRLCTNKTRSADLRQRFDGSHPQTVRSEAQYRGTPDLPGPHSGGAVSRCNGSRVTRTGLCQKASTC